MMELLAPAGTLDVFENAVKEGADAIYVGAPAINARALARRFTMAEIAAMIAYAHERDVKVYLAMNSLLKEEEIPQAVELLAALEALEADALIIQDLGIYYLAKHYFPGLRLHASTLFGAHNGLAVRQFAQMGFQRVVLARETTLEEIDEFHRQSPVELEAFVHGAMCFSYSGLCLFSSYLGGKSGLRGRCVQPCRRKYAWAGAGKGKRDGYFFSMNDLSAIDLVPRLREAGVSSLKIEGRMKNAHYVGSVVKAYRTMLDAPAGSHEDALAEAQELLVQAMGRKSTTGYFLSSQPKEVLSPQHSGNIGLFLGKIAQMAGKSATVHLKDPVRCGDRLRLHQEKSGERISFTLKKIVVNGKAVASAGSGEKVVIEMPPGVDRGDSLYKVDVRERRALGASKQSLRPVNFEKKVAKLVRLQKIDRILSQLAKSEPHQPGEQKKATSRRQGRNRPQRFQQRESRQPQPPLDWWLKIDDFGVLRNHMPLLPAQIVVTLSRETYSQFQRERRRLPHFGAKMIWSLPPVIEEAEVHFYEEAVQHLRKIGFQSWQIAHVGQLMLFPDKGSITVSGDYTLNVLNSLALRALKELGLEHVQALVETDSGNLKELSSRHVNIRTGLMVYGVPPLFTARVAADFFQYGRNFVSPKGEIFVLQKKWGLTVALPDKPFSLLAALPQLQEIGLSYVVVDLSHMRLKKREFSDLFKEISRPSRRRHGSTFNYYGTLQ